MASAFETLRVLGRGSYGTAVLARERNQANGTQHEGDLRVLKEVDLSQMQPAARQEACKEVEVLRSLQHVNIVAYHAAFLDSGSLYIVMEYADGGSLSDAIKARQCREMPRFTEREALAIFSQSCLALKHMHERHILHRDLKSQNIFLTKDGTVKLGDFGISKMLEHTHAEAMTVIGTPSYLAPEVCDSQPYGTKADVWSMGVVLYEVLTLELPFTARSLAALVVKIVTSKPQQLLASTCSKESRILVKKLLQKKPEKRPSTGEILAMPIILSHVMHFLSDKGIACDSEDSTRATSRNTSRSSTSSKEGSILSAKQELCHDEVPAQAVLALWKEKQARSKSPICRQVHGFAANASPEFEERTLVPLAPRMGADRVLPPLPQGYEQNPHAPKSGVCSSEGLKQDASPCSRVRRLGWVSGRQLPPLKLQKKLQNPVHGDPYRCLQPASARTPRKPASRPPRRLNSLPQQKKETCCRARSQTQEEASSPQARKMVRRPSSTPPARPPRRRLSDGDCASGFMSCRESKDQKV